MSRVQVSRNPERSRYEARINGELVGIAEYQMTDDLVVFTHTEVERAHEGEGVGGALARFALDEVRAEGVRTVLPLCPFIKAWMHRHDGYADLAFNAARHEVR